MEFRKRRRHADDLGAVVIRRPHIRVAKDTDVLLPASEDGCPKIRRTALNRTRSKRCARRVCQ